MNLQDVEDAVDSLFVREYMIKLDKTALLEEISGCESMAALDYYTAISIEASSRDSMVRSEIESLKCIETLMTRGYE